MTHPHKLLHTPSTLHIKGLSTFKTHQNCFVCTTRGDVRTSKGHETASAASGMVILSNATDRAVVIELVSDPGHVFGAWLETGVPRAASSHTATTQYMAWLLWQHPEPTQFIALTIGVRKRCD